MHVHVESEESTDGGYTLLSPFYWLFGHLGEPGQKASSGLKWAASFVPAALLTIPALTLTTLTVGIWGALAWHFIKRGLNWYMFKRALKTPYSGPITVSKEVCGLSRSHGEKLGAFIQGHLVPFIGKQPGLLRYSVHRGLGAWGQNSYCVVSDWATLEDFRKVHCSPEATNMKKHAPWITGLFGVRKCISTTVVAGQGPAGRSGETVAAGRKVVA
jgi:heme-degrading monooxygenase HmoA